MNGNIKVWLVAVVTLITSSGFGQKKVLFPLTIQFQNQVGDALLSFDSTYTNVHGEPFTVRNFRYYISHFTVTSVNGKMYKLPKSYFLVDERKPESKTLIFQIPFTSIKSIAFEIGVDSLKNVSGVQTGSLDPANGMFWTWNSGYIFAKLEGSSPQAKAPQNNFTYHIGGFRTGENAVRKVVLPMQQPLSSEKETLFIKADVNAWFGNVHAFKIGDLPSIMTPGPQAMQVADNYGRMFSVIPGR